MITPNARSEKATAFISYAREDVNFVRELVADLERRGIEPRGDWLLTSGEDYARRLREFNLAAHALIFVISPDSLKSDACRDELALAVENKKQVLPISHRDHGDDHVLDSALRSPHWTLLRDGDDFERGMTELVKAINTDFVLMDMHGRLLVAADNWANNGRNRSYLWGKEGLKHAEGWLAMTSAQPNKLPQPTPLETEFILAAQRARTRGTRIGFGIAASIMLALLLLSVFALAQRRTALENADLAMKQESIAKENEAEALRQKKSAEDNAKEAETQRGIAVGNLEEAQRQQAEAEKQTRIAKEQRQEAIDRGVKLQRASSDADYRVGNQFLASGEIADSVAYLSRALTTNPANSSASDRLFTLVMSGDQPLLARKLKPTEADPQVEPGKKKFDLSRDGTRVATVSMAGEAALWREDARQLPLALKGRKATGVKFLPNGDSLIVTTEDAILVFNAERGKQLLDFPLPGKLSQFGLSQAGDQVAVACDDGTFFSVPVTRDEPIRKLMLPATENVRSLSFVNKDKELAVLSEGGFFTWSLSESAVKAKEEFSNQIGQTERVSIAANGTFSFTEHDPGGLEEDPYADITVSNLPAPTGSTAEAVDQNSPPPATETAAKWPSPRYEFASAIDLAVNPKGSFVAITLDTDEAHILTAGGKDLMLRHEGVTHAGAHPSEEVVYTASTNGSVNLWDASSGKVICAPLWHQQPLVDATFASGGNFLASFTTDGTIYVWDIRQSSATAEKKALQPEVKESVWPQVRHDKKRQFKLTRLEDQSTATSTVAVWELLVNGTQKKTLYRQPLTEQTQNENLAEGTGFSPTIDAFFSENSATLVTIAGDGAPLVWRPNSKLKKPVLELQAASGSRFATEVYMTPLGDKALIGYHSFSGYRRPRYSYQIFSLTDGKRLGKEIQLRLDQSLLTVASDLEHVIVSEGTAAFVRAASDFHPIGQPARHDDRIARAIFRNDGQSFCTVSRDGSLRIWDMTTGFPLSEPLIFNPAPPSFGGPSWDDDYFARLPTPAFTDDEQRILFHEPEHRADRSSTSPSPLAWDISIRATESEARRFNELVRLIYGVRLGDTGALNFVPQLSMSELRERFQDYEGTDSALGRLIERLLTARESRSAKRQTAQ